jgi:hypothetical protein
VVIGGAHLNICPGCSYFILTQAQPEMSVVKPSDHPVIPAKEAVRKLTEAAKEALRRGCACFEMRPLGAPQHEVVL